MRQLCWAHVTDQIPTPSVITICSLVNASTMPSGAANVPRLIASPGELGAKHGDDAGTTIVMTYAGEELSGYQIRCARQ